MGSHMDMTFRPSSPSAGKDCGECEACLDKVKFGGRNIKKRACERRYALTSLTLLQGVPSGLRPGLG